MARLILATSLALLFVGAGHWSGFEARAGSLVFDGDFTQGGLVRGQTEPGTKISIDGRSVLVSGQGLFLFGFGRDAAARSSLIANFPDGTRQTRALKIAKRRYRIQRIDNLPLRQVSPSSADLKRIRTESALIRNARQMVIEAPHFMSGFTWPASGPLSGVFGSQRILNGQPRRPHRGVDVAAPAGTVVTAPADGVVSLAHPGMFFTGKTVMIDHGHGLTSIFAHMQEIVVRSGQRVARGAPLGEVGATGRVTGAHLHWGVNLFATSLDPQLLAGPISPSESAKTR